MKTKEELFDRCAEMFDDDGGGIDDEEREEQHRGARHAITEFERAVQVRTIRFAATWTAGGRAVLRDLADRIERGELVVPEES